MPPVHATRDDLDTMAKTVWAESRSEPFEGQVAVAWVIRNRALKGGWWGNTIGEVCLKPWQFSCWNDDDPQFEKIRAVTVADWRLIRALGVCSLVITQDLPDPTMGATHYYADYIQEPTWAKKLSPTKKIGHHTFLK
jgi:spore germination cell wall hydrolase CwlJ-like protein